MMEPDDVRRLLAEAFPDGDIEVSDLTGTKDHYQARIVSSAFDGKTLLAQHQLVYFALGDAMRGPIHALSLQTYSPDAWAKSKG
jgi:stress-induced morphogen